MKGRSVKLREAHKGAGAASPSFCSVVWGPGGSHVVTASAAGTAVLIHEAASVVAGGGGGRTPSSLSPVATLRHHKDGVTALAVAPGSCGSLASASIDRSVKFYSFPDGKFQSNVTRFTLPIRSLSFNRNGSLLAAAGDDDGIKLIATIDSTISKVLKGHKGSVTGLAFDPKNEYLASIDNFGTVIYWELSLGRELHTFKAIAPIFDSDPAAKNVLFWSPDGETLAIPGLRNDVVMYDRDTAEKLFTLRGDHEQPICSLCWSPNGRYLATSGLDKQVLIWDVELRQDIERQKFDEKICSLAWKPDGNALALIDVMGKFGIWENVVPSSMKSPVEGAPNLTASKVRLFDDEEDDSKPGVSGSLEDGIDESLCESTPVVHKRLRGKSAFDDRFDGDSEGDGDLMHQIESRKRMKEKHKGQRDGAGKAKGDSATSGRLVTTIMQAAFQPGSTPPQPGRRNFLAYNMLGSVTTIENEGHSHVEVDFHDTGRGPRVPSMTDYFGFTMAALNESGSVFANPCKGEKSMSTLMYRPFGSWANNSEWSMRFEGEEVKAVALGTGWVAAITSLNFLRIFTEGGLQKHILSTNGPVVTAAGYGDQLAIVSHASDCLPSGDQVLDVKVFNVSEGTQPIAGRLVLTPSSHLSWFGFSENGQLTSYDSKGILRVFSNQFGGSWLPLFSSTKARKTEDESHWIVGLDASNVFCVVCKSPDSYPQVMPKPVLTILELSFPLASSDLGADNLENEFLMRKLHLSQIQSKIEEMAASGQDTTALDDEAFNLEAAIDRCILRLISSCCNGDKLVRATELARLVSLEKSMKGALTLVTRLKLSILQEKFSTILEERMLNDSRGSNHAPQTISCPSKPAEVVQHVKKLQEFTLPAHPGNTNQGSTATETKLETEQSKDLKGGTAKVSPEQKKADRPTNPFAKIPKDQKKTEVKEKGERDIESGPSSAEHNQVSLRNRSSESSAEGHKGESQRPINPFAKSSTHKEKSSSLLDSIKKMKVENEKVDKDTNKKVKV